MNKLGGVLAGLLVPVFFVAGVIATPAMAQEKMAAKKMEKKATGKPTVKEIAKNNKVHVFEVTYKPGDESDSVQRPPAVVRALKGGTLTRIYPDGKKETVAYKTGEVKVFEARPAYVVKNAGNSSIVLYVVNLEQAK